MKNKVTEAQVGKIIHYYNKIGVAIVDVSAPLKVGDTIKISGHDKEFTQTVNSIQIEHQQIQSAKKGDQIGLKVDQPVKEKDLVYRVK